MSKLSEHYLQLEQEEFELDLSYAEWLEDNIGEPSEKEMTEMARDVLYPYTSNNLHLYVSSVNNIEYLPRPKGA